MEYLYVVIAFIFVTVIALILRSKRNKELKRMEEKEREFLMQEQIKAAAEIEAKKKAAQSVKQKQP